ncbi:SLC13 family permease [Azotobacter chroococcum]|uniref:Dicarboxylate carrier MatC N-terminal domain-containing protein n=1 Tax=Azotobacter chroococcum TaxID=353 RepID=A0AAP9YC21_9GAMM|nr:SLC13 family permease [Azotobacter chroococcum]QQE88023.1 hypothetical protein GKQ51_17440 [Azotobacter chroococcum]
MGAQWISIYVLVGMFVLAAVLPINMGVIAFAGAFLVGTLVAGMNAKAIMGGFPVDLFLTLLGITYLFVLAQNSGTIDWLVKLAVRAVRGRIAAIPWLMFFIAGALTSVGAVSPAAVAIIVPIALGFAARHGINPLMMGLMVIHGAQGGGFSPISIYGGITNKVVAKAGLPLNEIATMMASLAVNLTVASLLFFLMGGMQLIRQDEARVRGGTLGESLPGKPCKAGQVEDSPASAAPSVLQGTGARRYRIVTVAGLLVLVVLTLFFGQDIGFVSLTIGLVLTVMAPNLQKHALGQVPWPEILLVVGVSTYVSVLERMGTIDFVGHGVAGLTSPLVAALLLCFVGAVVSAFASSTAVLGSLIPLAVPFLLGDTGVSAVGFIAAMAVSSTIVDVSPFSTNGALVLANAQGVNRDAFFRQLLVYCAAVTLIAPVVVWLLFVVL